tara:strand:- start:762 stop:1574 length:813 start_codon:yes stop_codon:yes gene_type:complete
VSENNLFPRRSSIFKGNIRDVRDSVARPSLDTFYQVIFSFGNFEKWLEGSNIVSNLKRNQGRDFQRKMSILCTQAELPGTNYNTDTAIGHHQGIQETFPNLRNYPPLNLVFYCDADMVILEVLETWMSYINPIQTNKRVTNAYSRFNYPENYKEIIHITKFERDTFLPDKADKEFKSNLSSYEFVNVWPTNLTSMRIAYGDTNVLRCNVEFVYDRFFTRFNYEDPNQAVVNTPENIINSNDQQFQPLPVKREDGRFTTTGTNSILPLGGV